MRGVGGWRQKLLIMRAVCFHSPESVELIEVEEPRPAPGDALVRIEVSAICATELHAPPGSNPGHEAAGIIEHAPSDTGFSRGERVGLSAVTGCGQCRHCSRGVQLYCSHLQIHRAMHADYVAVPVSALRRLPPGTSADDAVLMTGDALGVPVRAHRRVPSEPGERVLVIGLGPIGLGHTLVRAHTGAQVIATEPSPFRRKVALDLGATEVVPPGPIPGPAPSLVIECTGLPDCISLALDVVERGGTVLQSGLCQSVELNPKATIIEREITYTGSWYYADEDFPETIRLCETGLPLGRMITHAFSCEQVSKAYAQFISMDAAKVALRWS